MWGLERRETGQGIVNRNTRKGETGSQRGRVDTEGRIKETRGGRERLISFYHGQIESSTKNKKSLQSSCVHHTLGANKETFNLQPVLYW